MRKRIQYIFILLYLAAITLANLLVAKFGAAATIPVGFALVSLDLTGRDGLHDLWKKGRLWKMTLLIAGGSALSWILNKDAGWIGISSLMAFTGANIIDTAIYHLARRKSFIWRVNISNGTSSLADSAIFLTIAFGSFMPLLIAGQFAAKFIGGFLWSLILRKIKSKYFMD